MFRLGRLLARLWFVWVALAAGAAVFYALWQPWEKSRFHQAHAAQLAEDLRFIERAVTLAAIQRQARPGEWIPAAEWQRHLPAESPARLRQNAHDPFGRAYGPQQADRDPQPPPETARLLGPGK